MSSGSRPGRKRAKPHHEEEHENHERWLVSYADMVTLLMCLFIVLFAISQVDQKKFAALSAGLAAGFGAPINALPGTTPEGSVLDALPAAVEIADGIAPGEEVARQDVEAAAEQAAAERAARVAAEAQTTYDDLAEVRRRIQEELDAAGYSDAARFDVDERGLVVHIVADQVLFDAEQAQLRPEGAVVLDALARALSGVPNELAIEGHANHLPVTPGGQWPSNWELSAYRATTVVRYLAGVGIPEASMSANGYSSTRPLVPETDPHAVTENRRVDIIVLSTASAEANALLPGLDAASRQGATP
jgi:chemotaxis protein MotB